MAKDSVRDWDADANNNNDVGGINIAENCPPGNINNAIREKMAQIRRAMDNGDLVAAPTIKTTRITTPTSTHTFDDKVVAAWVQMTGGGGAGAGGRPPSAADVRAGSGGSSGEYVEFALATIPPAKTANITVGAAGAGGTGNGGNGGATIYNDGTINLTAAGGIGGGAAESASLFIQKGATAPFSAQVGNEVRSSKNGGQSAAFVGNPSFGGSTYFAAGGEGGGSPLGVGGGSQTNFAGSNENGLPGRGYGAGGGGCASNSNTLAAATGGDGAPGIVIIYELVNTA